MTAYNALALAGGASTVAGVRAVAARHGHLYAASELAHGLGRLAERGLVNRGESNGVDVYALRDGKLRQVTRRSREDVASKDPGWKGWTLQDGTPVEDAIK